MVAYSFKPSFIPHILAKVKRQTIRLPRKRHARPGEGLQLFHGPRMKPVRIGGAVCQGAKDVRLDFGRDLVTIDDAIELTSDADLNTFAIRDGFLPPDSLADRIEPWEYMARWWAITHPDHGVFPGVLIDWDDTFQPPVAA